MADEGPTNFQEVLDRLLETEQEVVGDPPVVEREVIPVIEEDALGLSSLLGGAKEKAGDLFEWYKRFSYPEFPDQKEDVLSDVQIPPEKPTPPPIPDWRNNDVIQSIIEAKPIIGRIIQAESLGDPEAISKIMNEKTGEEKLLGIGLMQVGEETGRQPGYGLKSSLSVEELLDPEKNVVFGAKYFEALQNHFGNDYHALVGYNWGPTNAEKWIGGGAKFEELPDETKGYVTKIIGVQKRTGGMISRNPYPHNPRPI